MGEPGPPAVGVPLALAGTGRRYVAGSVVTALAGQALLFGLFVGLRWSARGAQATAFALTGFLSYHVNRRWVWGRTGRSDAFREVLPFWVIAAAGLVLSTVAVGLAESHSSRLTANRVLQAMAVDAAAVGVLGGLWIAKFVLLSRLFVRPATDGPG